MFVVNASAREDLFVKFLFFFSLCPKKYRLLYLSVLRRKQIIYRSERDQTRERQMVSGLRLHYGNLPCWWNVCIRVWQRQRKGKKSESEWDSLQWFMTSCRCICVCVLVCVSRWEGPPVVHLRHSVHQRRSVLFVLLHPSVSDGSWVMMTGRAIAAGADASLWGGRPPSSSTWRVLHAALVVTVHADLWHKSVVWFHSPLVQAV